MAYPTVGTEGKVVSWGAAGSLYETILAGVRPMSAVVSFTSNDQEVTGLDAVTSSSLPGIRSVSATLRGYIAATPYLAYRASVRKGGGDTQYVSNAYAWDFTWASSSVHDITPFDSGSVAVVWRTFRPEYTNVSGSFTCYADSATALTNIQGAGDTLPTLSLYYQNDAYLTGSALMSQASASVANRQKNTVTYNYRGSGSWGAAGAASLFSTYTFAAIPWSAGGSAHPLVVATLTGSKTISIADSFIRSMTIRCDEPGRPVMFEAQVQGSGAVTMA